MNKKSIILTLFVLVALAQLFVPYKMIWDREVILKEGVEIKLKTAPIDPNDPFRGKYIVLDYEENTIQTDSVEKWISGEDIYVFYTADADGFVKIKSVSRDMNPEEKIYVKAKVGNRIWNDTTSIRIDYDFDRFYMEESKAKGAEEAHQKAQIDSTKTTYALVSVKDGNAVVKDVFIDDVSVRELVKKNK